MYLGVHISDCEYPSRITLPPCHQLCGTPRNSSLITDAKTSELSIHEQNCSFRAALWVLCVEIQKRETTISKQKRVYYIYIYYIIYIYTYLANCLLLREKKKRKPHPNFCHLNFCQALEPLCSSAPAAALPGGGAMRNAKPLSNPNVAPAWNITSTAEFSSRSSYQLTEFFWKLGH